MVTGGYGDLERDRTIWSRVVAYTKILDSYTVLECKAPEYGRLENATRLKLPVPPGYLSQRLTAMTENEIQLEGRSDYWRNLPRLQCLRMSLWNDEI
jgi:hypothetical protein